MTIWTEAYQGGTRENPTGVEIPLSQVDKSAFKQRNLLAQEAILDHDMWKKIDLAVMQNLDQVIIAERMIKEVSLGGLWYSWNWPAVERPDRSYISMEFEKLAGKIDVSYGEVDVPIIQNEVIIPRRELAVTRARNLGLDTLWTGQAGRNMAEDLDDLYFNGWTGANNIIYGLTDLGTGTGTQSRPIPVAEGSAVAWDTVMGPIRDITISGIQQLIAFDMQPPYDVIVTPYNYGQLADPLEGPAANSYLAMSGLAYLATSPFIRSVYYSKQMDQDKYNAADSDMCLIKPEGFDIGVGAPMTSDPVDDDGNHTRMKIWCAKTIRQRSYEDAVTAGTWYKAQCVWTTNNVT
jgi:hypothetical protein